MFFHTSISSKRTTVVTSTTRKMENIKKCDKQKNVIFFVCVCCVPCMTCVCGNIPFNELCFPSMSKWKKFTSFKEYLKIYTSAHSSADFIIMSSPEFHSIFLLYYCEERKFFIFIFSYFLFIICGKWIEKVYQINMHGKIPCLKGVILLS